MVTAGGKSQHSSTVTDGLSVKKSAGYLLMVTSATGLLSVPLKSTECYCLLLHSFCLTAENTQLLCSPVDMVCESMLLL